MAMKTEMTNAGRQPMMSRKEIASPAEKRTALPCPSNATAPGMTYRQHLLAQITPVCVKHFLNDVDWEDYDDMAATMLGMVDAIITAEQETSE